ncbi:MAG TPA: hypothetical protein VK421_11555 [Pyrinomonadaceae bacterium]|nr:hypothetical protein [Pyrinomonadaceae bacterium]
MISTLPKSRVLRLASLLLLVVPCPVAAQGRERIIDWFRRDDAPGQALTQDKYGKTITTDLMALEIVAVSVGGKRITPGQPFAAGDDWMKDLRVRARNISPKPIARVSLTFHLPEAKHGDAFLAVSLRFGKGVGPCVDGGEPEVAMPGEEFDLIYRKTDYEFGRQWIADLTGVTSIRRADIESVRLIFDDCVHWGLSLTRGNARPAAR